MLGKTKTIAACAVGLGLAAAALPALADPPPQIEEGAEIVLSPENNHLNAYDMASGERYRVITSQFDDVADGRDINGQVCMDPAQPGHFIAGEDTGQEFGSDATDPLQMGRAGWGYFELTDSDETPVANGGQGIGARQVGKLVPSYLGKPDNHGCGFLGDGRLVTATIGDVYPGEPGNGELIVWFGDLDDRYHDGYDVVDGVAVDGDTYNIPWSDGSAYCKIAIDIPTAGGIWVDGQDVYIASNRPSQDFSTPGGVWRYTVPPTFSGAQCTGVDASGAPVADPGAIERELVVAGPGGQFGQPVNPLAATPSGVVGNAAGNLYVSSVFSGTITEYDPAGNVVRPILLPGMAALGGEHVTPYGMVIDGAGDLWVADLGVSASTDGGLDAAEGEGSILRIPIDDVTGLPGVPQVIDRFLTYPDGLGITTFTP